MEEDTIFYGSGIRIPKIKLKVPELKFKGFDGYKSSGLEVKKQRQTGRVSAKKASISKVSAQKAQTAKFQAARAQTVKARAIEAKRTKIDELETKFENPMFRNRVAKTLEAKQGAFGKKLSPDELRGKVDAEMNKIKQNAELKAQKAAADAKQKIANNNNAVTASSKATLSGKINKLKSDFANRIDAIRNRGITPGDRPRVDDPGRMKNDGVDAKNKGNDAADANANAKGDAERFRDGSNKADGSANRIEGPTTKPDGPGGPGRTDGPGGPDGPDGPGGPGRPEGPEGPGGPGRPEGPDAPQRLRESDAKNKSNDAKNKGNDAADANANAKGDAERFRDGSNKADGSANRIEGPDGTRPDGTRPDGTRPDGTRPDGTRPDGTRPDGTRPDGTRPDGTRPDTPERVREGDAKNKADTAKNKGGDNLNRARGLVNKVKKFLRKVAGLLGQILMVALPIVIAMIPNLISQPRPPRSLPPLSFNIKPPPPPIISPEGDDNLFALYVPPTGTSGPGSALPPEGAQPPEGTQPPPEGAEVEYDESFGNIVFQLTEQPTESVSFQISSLSDSLEFDENIVTFPLENWSAPVYLNFISTLETSPEEIVDDIRDNVSEKLDKLKQEKRVDKRPNITIGSLDDYSATNDEINARRKRLEYMLKPAETIQEALAKINKRVRMRQSLVEPTYDGGYSEYRGIVEPTYDTKITEEQVEPTYDDSEYKILEDKVYPSEKIIEEETYKPIEDIIEPTYDDTEYKDYIDPTLDGGQEEEEEEEEESFEEDILPELDYDTIVSRIDETELSDNYKAEIEFILLEEVSSEVNIVISVLDPTWTLKPNMISFDNENSSASSFFFSEEIYKKLQNVYAEQYANQVEDKFDEYIEDEYETGMNNISEQEEDNRIREDEVYDDVYDKVYQQELSKIEDSEYILEQLGGYTKPTVSNLFKRTRKLPRVVEK